MLRATVGRLFASHAFGIVCLLLLAHHLGPCFAVVVRFPHEYGDSSDSLVSPSSSEARTCPSRVPLHPGQRGSTFQYWTRHIAPRGKAVGAPPCRKSCITWIFTPPPNPLRQGCTPSATSVPPSFDASTYETPPTRSHVNFAASPLFPAQISHAAAFELPFAASLVHSPQWEISLVPAPTPSITIPQPTPKPLPLAPAFPNAPPPPPIFGKASPKPVPLRRSINKDLGKILAVGALSPPDVATSDYVTEHPHSASSVNLQDLAKDLCLHEAVAAILAIMIYSPSLQLPLNHPPFATTSSLGPQLRHSKDLAEAEAVHKADGERLQLAIHAQGKAMHEVAERAKAARHASLYRARQEELIRKMQELEAAEAEDAEAFARQKDASATQRLIVNRQLDHLQQAASVGVPPLGARSCFCRYNLPSSSPFGPCATILPWSQCDFNPNR